MEWLLTAVVLWNGQPASLSAPMASKELCETALRKLAYEMRYVPGSRDTVGGATFVNPLPKVAGTCLRVSGKATE
jgi:hypothetical protein